MSWPQHVMESAVLAGLHDADDGLHQLDLIVKVLKCSIPKFTVRLTSRFPDRPSRRPREHHQAQGQLDFLSDSNLSTCDAAVPSDPLASAH